MENEKITLSNKIETIKLDEPKSEMKIGDMTIYHQNKRFNWLNRFMFKTFFGIEIINLK